MVDAAAGARIAKGDWAWEIGYGLIERHCHSSCSSGSGREHWRWRCVENRETGLREKRGMGCLMQDKDSWGPSEEDVAVLNR